MNPESSPIDRRSFLRLMAGLIASGIGGSSLTACAERQPNTQILRQALNEFALHELLYSTENKHHPNKVMMADGSTFDHSVVVSPRRCLELDTKVPGNFMGSYTILDAHAIKPINVRILAAVDVSMFTCDLDNNLIIAPNNMQDLFVIGIQRADYSIVPMQDGRLTGQESCRSGIIGANIWDYWIHANERPTF